MKKIAVLMLFTILLISCSSSRRILVKIWTNKADIPLYAEVFNNNQDNYKVQVLYVKDLSGELVKSESHPDIVIGDYLNSSDTITYFQNLEGLFYHEKRKPQGIRTDNMYAGLLDICKAGTSAVLLPLSFNIPGFVYSKDNSTDFIIDLDDIHDRALEFNRKEGHMAFSYFWNFSSVLNRLAAHDFYFTESSSEILAWNNDRLLAELKNLSVTEKELNGTYRTITSFYNRYHNAPSYELLEGNRILYDFIFLSDYLKIPAEKRSSLDISWLGSEGRIPVYEEITFAGIHKQAGNSRGAKSFLKWIFNTDNQVFIMRQLQTLHLNSFGILGGLSSLKNVNENEFPQLYPDLLGNIPNEENLKFPNVYPPGWPLLKKQVIIPWLREYLSGEPGLKTLPETFKTWKNQYTEQ